MNKPVKSNLKKPNNSARRRKISRDKRPLIIQSSSSSDYYFDARFETPDALVHSNENDHTNDRSAGIPKSNEREKMHMKPGGAYNWKTYDPAISDITSTATSVTEVETKQTKSRSCFDSFLMSKRIGEYKNTSNRGESFKEKIKKCNCVVPMEKFDPFRIQQSSSKDGTASGHLSNEDKTNIDEDPNSDLTALSSTSETSSTDQDLIGFQPSPSFKGPNNELLDHADNLSDLRCLNPNKCHVNTSYYLQKNNRPYMEDTMTIELLGSKIIDHATPKIQNLSRKEYSEKRFDEYYDSSPRSSVDFDVSSFTLTPLQRETQPRQSLSIFAVFDGHGGDQASLYCSDEVSSYLCEQETFPQNISAALNSTCRQMDEDFISSGHLDGTTACICVLSGTDHVVCANVGDSRAIIVRSDGTVIPLSRDHKPNDPREVKRIKELGGTVTYRDRWRVQGTLAVSRGIGDAVLKPYVTSEPDIMEHTIDAKDLFLVIASDGIWDVLSNNDVAEIVLKHSCISSNGRQRTFPPNFKWTARQLCKQAIRSNSNDNLSAIVVDLTEHACEI